MSDDDHRFSEPGPDPEGINLMTIKAHIELPIDQISRLQTQLAQAALDIIFATALVTTALEWWFSVR